MVGMEVLWRKRACCLLLVAFGRRCWALRGVCVGGGQREVRDFTILSVRRHLKTDRRIASEFNELSVRQQT
jgi:hypothetical protein